MSPFKPVEGRNFERDNQGPSQPLLIDGRARERTWRLLTSMGTMPGLSLNPTVWIRDDGRVHQ
jgi:hypothetical protein